MNAPSPSNPLRSSPAGELQTSNEKHHILLVEDDDFFRSALSQTLADAGFHITSVPHAKHAQEVLGDQPVHLVLSDINLPGINGFELLKNHQSVKPNIPFILMSGFSELTDSEEANQLGAKAVLSKPFRKEDLLQTIDQALFPLTSHDTPNLDFQFSKVKLQEFVSGQNSRFPLFIRLSESKYIKIAHAGDTLPPERLKAYAAKGVQYLYLKKEDFKKYMEMNLSLLPLVSAQKQFPKEKKIAFLKHSSEVILEHLYFNEVKPQSFKDAQALVEGTLNLLQGPNSESNPLSDEAFNLLPLLNAHSDHLYTHALGVSLYSVMIARELTWKSEQTLTKLALGGLLHDIGKKELPPQLLKKARREFSAQELELYESHPQRGVELLSQIPSVPSDVIQIIAQHHENCLGLGFPLRLKRHHIHPLARIVAIANEFCNGVLKEPLRQQLSPQQAILRMHTIQPGRFDPDFLAALAQLFGLTLPTETSSSRERA
ncbi:MAG: HD domain-containing phosphohydrolase [Bdellovibrionia bacterium]